MILLREYLYHRRRAQQVEAVAARRSLPVPRSGPSRWLWWALQNEAENAWLFLRAAFDEHVPLPASWDVAISNRFMRHRERRWPGWQYPDIELPGCCAVCAARWPAGRTIKHPACERAIEHAIEVAVGDK